MGLAKTAMVLDTIALKIDGRFRSSSAKEYVEIQSDTIISIPNPATSSLRYIIW